MMSEAIFLRHICCARRKNSIKAVVLVVVWDRLVCLCMYLLFSELSHACMHAVAASFFRSCCFLSHGCTAYTSVSPPVHEWPAVVVCGGLSGRPYSL